MSLLDRVTPFVLTWNEPVFTRAFVSHAEQSDFALRQTGMTTEPWLDEERRPEVSSSTNSLFRAQATLDPHVDYALPCTVAAPFHQLPNPSHTVLQLSGQGAVCRQVPASTRRSDSLLKAVAVQVGPSEVFGVLPVPSSGLANIDARDAHHAQALDVLCLFSPPGHVTAHSKVGSEPTCPLKRPPAYSETGTERCRIGVSVRPVLVAEVIVRQ